MRCLLLAIKGLRLSWPPSFANTRGEATFLRVRKLPSSLVSLSCKRKRRPLRESLLERLSNNKINLNAKSKLTSRGASAIELAMKLQLLVCALAVAWTRKFYENLVSRGFLRDSEPFDFRQKASRKVEGKEEVCYEQIWNSKGKRNQRIVLALTETFKGISNDTTSTLFASIYTAMADL